MWCFVKMLKPNFLPNKNPLLKQWLKCCRVLSQEELLPVMLLLDIPGSAGEPLKGCPRVPYLPSLISNLNVFSSSLCSSFHPLRLLNVLLSLPSRCPRQVELGPEGAQICRCESWS